jgi:hypothetical protein
VSGIASCIFDANGAAANATVINSPITVGACADGTATGSTAYEPVGVALAAVSGGATGQISVTHRKTPKSIVTAPTSFTATGAIDMTTTGTASLCNLPATYNSSSAGTLTIGSGASPGCITTVTALGTGLATIAVTGGSFVSNTACAATPRTKGQGSTIGIQIISNAGSAPVVSVSGDCG